MNTENIASYADTISKPASRASAYEHMEGWKEGARALFLWQLQNTGVARPRTPSYSVLSQGCSAAILNVFSGTDPKKELDTVAADFKEDYDTYYKK